MWRWSIFAAAMLLSACDMGADVSYRYRVTVEIDTPQGLRSGSSVWETKSWEGSGIPDTAIRSRDRGEAVAIDLPSGTLFALMQGADMDVDYASGVVAGHVRKNPPPGFPETKDWKEQGKAIAKHKPAFELYPDDYPLLVRFRDINDPASVEKVEPTNLGVSFGPGVSLRRVTIAVTNEGVTKGIAERLPWLTKEPEKRLDGKRFTSSTRLANVLSNYSFSSEIAR